MNVSPRIQNLIAQRSAFIAPVVELFKQKQINGKIKVDPTRGTVYLLIEISHEFYRVQCLKASKNTLVLVLMTGEKHGSTVFQEIFMKDDSHRPGWEEVLLAAIARERMLVAMADVKAPALEKEAVPA